MVFLANINGTISSVIPSVVTQGSNLVQSIDLVCPALSKYTTVDTIFTLPGGQAPINGGVMTPSSSVSIDGVQINAFHYSLSNSVTNFPGSVGVIFKCYNSSGEILATYTGQFQVVKTTKPILPEAPDAEVYEQLLSAIAFLNGKIETGELATKGILPYDENFAYQQGIMTYLKTDDVVDFYISLVANNLGNELTDATSWYKVNDCYKKTEVDAKFLQKDFAILAERTYLQLVDFVALHSENVTYKTSLDTLRTYLTQGLVGLSFEIVEELPATGVGNIVYMVPYITEKESYPSLEDFPETGEADKRYIAEDTGLTYLWEDDEYKEYDAGYIEYIWIEEKNKYENIGLSKIQLGEYAKISWVNETFIKFTDIVDNLTTNDATKPLSAKQGKNLNDNKININDIVNNLTTDDDTKPVSAKQAKILQDNKIDKTDIVDNLTTDDATKVLSAKQGKLLQDNKADKTPTATENNFASFDNKGNTKDSGSKASDFILNDKIVSEFQDIPDDNHLASEKLVKDELDLKANLTGANFTGDVNVASGKTYKINGVDVIGDKAKVDASNLTAENVESWQEKLGNSLLVADVTLGTNASSITINDLDIVADGGVYDFVCMGEGSTNDGISLRINNTTTGYYGTINRVNSTLSVTGSATNQCYYFNNAASFFMGDVANSKLTLITGTICVDASPTTIYASCNGLLTSQGAGNQSSGTFGGQVYSASHNNITSITILVGSSTTLITGTRVRIYKRAVNEV